MKILFVSNFFPPNAIGGYERLCERVAVNLSSSHDVIILTSDFGSATADGGGFKIYRELRLLTDYSDIYKPFKVSKIKRATLNSQNIETLRNIIALEKPDIVFVWNLKYFDNTFLLALEKLKRKVVYFLTDSWLVEFLNPQFLRRYSIDLMSNARGPISLLKIWAKKAILSLFKRNDPFHLQSAAIFASNFIRDLHTNAGITFAKSAIIHNGIALNGLIDRNIKRMGEVSSGKIKLLFAGRVVHIKGVHILVDALHLLITKHGIRNVELTIIGDHHDDEYERLLSRQINSLKIADRITFKDFIGENDLFDEFQKYDIYIFPSLYEPFSLTLIHALAAGIPTIASNAGGNPEIIIDGTTGLLYEKYSSTELAMKIKFLLDNPGLKKAISENGRQKAQEFGFDEMCSKIRNYIEINYAN